VLVEVVEVLEVDVVVLVVVVVVPPTLTVRTELCAPLIAK
jgi:hypothetical protein